MHRILTYTNLFPNRRRPNAGIFIKNRMRAFVEYTGTYLDVVAPVPYFPRLPVRTRWAHFSNISSAEVIDGLNVYHPRYLVVPKVGMSTHGLSMYLSTFRLVQELHSANHYNLIDAHWIYPDGWAAVKIAKYLGLPVVLSARGNDINEYIEYPIIRKRIIWGLRHCDHIISVCQALKNLMLDLGVAESKITVIGNGVDTNRFYPTPVEFARQKLGLPMSRPIVLSVGLLEPRKGHHILIEAMSLLKRRRQKFPLLVVAGSGLYRNNLEDLVSRFYLQNDVRFIGEVPNSELQSWYSAADLLCLASDREGWPNVLLEAIACGTPVIGTEVYGIPEVVQSEKVGSVVKERTPWSFAEAISNALAREWDEVELLKYAKCHTWERVARSVEQVFAGVLSDKTSRKIAPRLSRDLASE